MSNKSNQLSISPKIHVVYEDDDLLVFDKPSGLIVNRSKTAQRETMQDHIDSNYSLEVSDAPEFKDRSGIIHRLDKDTSGVLMVSKNEDAFRYYQKQFKKRRVEKTYFAVVFGRFKDSLIEINAPIARDAKNRIKFAVSKQGKDATTKVEVIDNFSVDGKEVSSVIASPETGRTHQIRVHLTALNHPIVGDSIYSGRKRVEWSNETKEFGRLMLHAKKLKVKLYSTKEDMIFESVLPEEFKPYFQA